MRRQGLEVYGIAVRSHVSPQVREDEEDEKIKDELAPLVETKVTFVHMQVYGMYGIILSLTTDFMHVERRL